MSMEVFLNQYPVVIVLFVLLACAGMWVVIVKLIGLISGWSKIAQLYPDQPTAPRILQENWVYGRVGVIFYNGTLVLETTVQGLRIKMMPGFGMGHPTLFIPWSELQGPETKGKIWLANKYTLSRMPNKALFFNAGVAQWIEAGRTRSKG